MIEVLSPGSSDIDPGRKPQTYARYGVPEYWIVDPIARTITAHAKPAGTRYAHIVTGSGTIEALTLHDLQFTLTPAQGSQ